MQSVSFTVFDKDKDGYINAQDLKTTMNEIGEEMTEEEALKMIRQANPSVDDHVNYKGLRDLPWCHNSRKLHFAVLLCVQHAPEVKHSLIHKNSATPAYGFRIYEHLENEGFISDEEIDCYIDEQPAHGKESNKPEESIASDGCNVS